MITTNSSIEDKKLLGLILPRNTMETSLCVQDAQSKLKQGGSSDQELQKQRTSHGKQPAIKSMEIMDREVKQLRRRCIPVVKVRWNSEFTWEREDQIRAKYPHLFSNITQSLN
ncbi:hypothetical protein Tco_1055927 [Tanacetum coccineum]|uniref:Reverse transcriptase n=1 Tax=Tanacetum coccineum TaxID=301880 RepID=A0ABQ5H2H7_9ASTR